MKKIRLFTFTILMLIYSVFAINTNAASVPYSWNSNGIDIAQGTINGASIDKEGKTVTLTLNNYNGGALELFCYGSEQDNIIFNIVLVGDNIINTNENIGITSKYKVSFLGNGNLTINATKPISYENYSNYLYISPSENIISDTKSELKDNTNNNETKSEEKTNDTNVSNEDVKSDSNNNLVLYIFGGYILLSLILFLLIFININKIRNKLK